MTDDECTALVRRAHDVPSRNLWPRLAARLREEAATELVRLHFPPVTWRVAAALVAAVVTLVVVPEPARFLAAFGML
jgi:hypothetical protein